MSKLQTVTAIILCKNGAATLGSALESVAFCEHVIMGDDNSTDSSIEIAKSHRVDVIKVPDGLGFAQKRNFLLEYVRTPWALFIDVDEIVTPTLRDELGTIAWSSETRNGFFIKREDVFMGKKLRYGETAQTTLLRLARVGTGKWERSVHELWAINGETTTLSGVLEHHSHPNLEEFFEKINRYTQEEATVRVPHAHKPQPFYQFLVFVQLFVYPTGKFVQNYLLRRGFLDGFPGFIMAWMMSFHSLCVRIQVLERLSVSSKKIT